MPSIPNPRREHSQRKFYVVRKLRSIRQKSNKTAVIADRDCPRSNPCSPRYLFIWLDLGKDNIAPIRSTRGISILVSFDGILATVPDPFIDTFNKLTDSDTVPLHPEATLFAASKTVVIVYGPLQRLEAIFKAHDAEQRSIILLDILGKTQQVRIDMNNLASAHHG